MAQASKKGNSEAAKEIAKRDTSQQLVGRLADRYGVSSEMLLASLRDSVFRTGKDQKPLSNVELAAALILADTYGLNPFAKEIYCVRDKRGGILTIVPVDGWAKIVNSMKDFDGCEFSWEWREDRLPHSCTCTMWVREREHPVSITEYYDECYRETEPWQRWPRRMLRHKAYIQAARLAYGLSGAVDEDEAERYLGTIKLGETEPRRSYLDAPPDPFRAQEVRREAAQDGQANQEAPSLEEGGEGDVGEPEASPGGGPPFADGARDERVERQFLQAEIRKARALLSIQKQQRFDAEVGDFESDKMTLTELEDCLTYAKGM